MPDFLSLVCSFLQPPTGEDNENSEDGPTFPPITGRPTSPPITSRPTSPPVQPTNRPTTGTPTPKPTLKCFANRNELKAAIDTYIANGCSDSKSKCGDIGDKYGLPIGSWCVSAVTDYEQLFYDAATFNDDISGWDTSAVTKMDATFAASGSNGDLNTWDTGRVTRKIRVSIVLCVIVEVSLRWDFLSLLRIPGGILTPLALFYMLP